jgi:hypothetical protein
MEVDSLVISLGLDPQQLRQALGQVEAMLRQFVQRVNAFAGDFQQGFNDAANSVEQASNAAARQADAAGESAQEAGHKFQKAGKDGGQGMQELAAKTRQAGAAARQTGGEMQTLGRKWGAFLGGMAARFAAPLAGALSAGAIVGGYMRDVSQVAQMTGRYSTQMEEWRKKRELLSRISREDVELYRQGKLALLDFNFAMAGLSTTIMRALSPAIRFGIDLLTSLADWIRRNEPNIIRFFAVLAGTITAVLIPAFARLAKTMLMNPLTLIIAGILLLALVIDDLVTYIRGGESKLEGLWSQFGTGEEIARSLGEAWEWLKSVGEVLFDGLLSAGKAFIANFGDAFEGLKGVVQGTINFIKAVFAGNWEDAGAAVRQAFTGAFEYILGIFKGIIRTIRDAIAGLLDMMPSWEGIKSGAAATWKGIKDFGAGLLGGNGEAKAGTPTALPPTNAELTRTAVPPSATVNNTKNQKIDATYNTNVYAPGADPQAMANAFGNQMRQQNAQFGALAAEGGVRP